MNRLAAACMLGSLLCACAAGERGDPLDAHPAANIADETMLIELERSRLAAFVAGDWDLLDALHAEDFELVNPQGIAWSKSQYLGPMRAGRWQYLVFEPVGQMRASVRGDAGAVRYRSRLSLQIGETVLPASHYRHTDYYERRDGRWQVVFSQATPEQQDQYRVGAIPLRRGK